MKKTTYTLALEFDVNQITRSLQFDFIGKTKNTDVNVGPLAGTEHFSVGDEVEFSVTATGKNQDEIGFSVSDCTLVSLGTSKLGKFYLSPFSKKKATTRISGSEWGPTKDISSKTDIQNGRTRLTCKSEKALPIKAPNGQWEIYGYLSVEITIDGKFYNRVFYFDPEGTTGNGGDLSFP